MFQIVSHYFMLAISPNSQCHKQHKQHRSIAFSYQLTTQTKVYILRVSLNEGYDISKNILQTY